MPIYEYLCSSCEKVTETVQKFSDAPLTDCEKCGAKSTLSKQVSLSSFSLKGSGWYATDYKKSSAPASSTSAAEAKTESSTEAKPAEKAAPAAPSSTSSSSSES